MMMMMSSHVIAIFLRRDVINLHRSRDLARGFVSHVTRGNEQKEGNESVKRTRKDNYNCVFLEECMKLENEKLIGTVSRQRKT